MSASVSGVNVAAAIRAVEASGVDDAEAQRMAHHQAALQSEIPEPEASFPDYPIEEWLKPRWLKNIEFELKDWKHKYEKLEALYNARNR